MRKLTNDYMRVNLVAGAVTSPHTDTMRGATPNFFMVEKPAKDDAIPFCLMVRMFPNFKTSIVPHKQKRSHLLLIGLKGNNPHYYVYPTHYIEKLEPFGELKGVIVVGIVKNKLQVMPDEYRVYRTTNEMETITFEEAVALARRNPAVLPSQKYRYYDKPGVWHSFVGWKHSHMLLSGCDHRMRRIHVFYRPVREETSSARVRTRKRTGTPINYTFMAGAQLDKH